MRFSFGFPMNIFVINIVNNVVIIISVTIFIIITVITIINIIIIWKQLLKAVLGNSLYLGKTFFEYMWDGFILRVQDVNMFFCC